MAVYFITGKLGCGKTLCTVGKIRDYLEQGRRVATNLDIYPEAITKKDSRATVMRLPDKPALTDLEMIGLGCEESDESKYGLLVLDELGTWFNSRNWRDKGRFEVINWFLHARKLHWDVYLIVQNINSLDDQLVSALCEHLVICKRTDRLTIPIIGPVLKTLGFQKVLPKIHVAKVYYGQTTTSMSVDRWWYRGKDLYSAYNTDQVFSEESEGLYTVLPAYYRNNIALIEHHNGKIKALTANQRQIKPVSVSYMVTASIIFAVIFSMISYRTYAKYHEFIVQSEVQQIEVVNKPVDTTPKENTKELTKQIDPSNQTDFVDLIKKMTIDAQITATSFYAYEGHINAILHLKQGDLENSITLDDTRAQGYVTVVQGQYATVTKGNYSFTFKTP